jgi:hypothetical protein
MMGGGKKIWELNQASLETASAQMEKIVKIGLSDRLCCASNFS